MTVLHVVYNSYPDTTGGAIRTRCLVETQARRGVRPVVLSSPFQPPADPARGGSIEYCKGIPYYRCYNGADPAGFMAAKAWWRRGAKLAALPAFTRRIIAVARRERADLLHAHNLFFCGLAAVAAGWVLGLPVVYEVRSLVEEGAAGAGSLARWIWRRLETLTCRLATRVIVLCQGLAEEMRRRGIPAHRITVSGNGVDGEAHRPPPVPRRPEGFAVGYCGTLHSYEGLDLLLAAAARLAPRHPELRVLLVGDGPARPALEEQARRLGLEARVHFAGRVPHDQVAPYYSAIDLFVLPRRRSYLTDTVPPLKPLEIMAYGKPLLASDCGGHRELIQDGVNGRLFPAGDAETLAARVEELRRAPGDLGARARQWVERHRSWDEQVRPVLDLYEQLRNADVLLVAPAPAPVPTGGVETGVAMMLRSSLARRHRIELWDRRRRRLVRFAARVALRRPRIVHIKSSSGVNFWESAAYAALGRALGCHVLLQMHSGEFGGWYERHRAAGRWAICQGLRQAAELLALSKHGQDLLARLAPDRPVHVVPNGVEVPGATSGRSANGAFRVLTIGTLGRHKGHFEILEAAAQLRGAPVRFLLAGPDETSGRGEGAALRRHAARLGLNGQVAFLGPVDASARRKLLRDADVFLLPSHAEGMPNAVLEAMAAGLPVIATPVGALPEMLPEGVLVPPGDASAIARAVLDLARDSVRRRELGRRNHLRAAEHYALEHTLRFLDRLYCHAYLLCEL
jgi:glycosyltransferase involved in cell wall biosynthesis